jgi:hypothetical protein
MRCVPRFVVVASVAAFAGCFMTKWELRSGAQAVPVCPGGETNSEASEPCPEGTGGTNPDGVLLASEAGKCTSLLLRYGSIQDGCSDFLFRFDTDDAGVPTDLCVLSTSFVPDYATCLAEKLAESRFPANQRQITYRVRFVMD